MPNNAHGMARIHVSFKVPRIVRAALERDAKECAVSLPAHVRHLLTPLVPSALCLWTGHPGEDQNAG